MPQPTEITQFIFGRPLSSASAPTSQSVPPWAGVGVKVSKGWQRQKRRAPASEIQRKSLVAGKRGRYRRSGRQCKRRFSGHHYLGVTSLSAPDQIGRDNAEPDFSSVRATGGKFIHRFQGSPDCEIWGKKQTPSEGWWACRHTTWGQFGDLILNRN